MEAELGTGVVRFEAAGQARVHLGSGLSCDENLPPQGPRLSLQIERGPGGAVYLGPTSGARVSFRGFDGARVRIDGIIASLVRVRLEPTELTPGSAVRGSLEFDEMLDNDSRRDPQRYRAAGRFSALVCPPAPHVSREVPPNITDAKPGAVQGDFAGVAFAARSALAIVARDITSDQLHLSSIEFFARAITCKELERHTPAEGTIVAVSNLGGGTARTFEPGAPQPVSALFTANPGPTLAYGPGPTYLGWLKLDRLSLRRGDTLTGSVHVQSSAGAPLEQRGTLSGHFEAEVCNPYER